MNESDQSALAIEITDLTVAYGEKPVLWDVDVSVPAGTLMAIVGPNGAGKTTLIKAALAVTRQRKGTRFWIRKLAVSATGMFTAKESSPVWPSSML